jgi:class 3 adenylate cyclase
MRADSHGQPQEGRQNTTPQHGGLVALLFTDVVGSTALKQQLGDHAGVALVQQHHALVRKKLKQFPHAEESSTAGDSFFLVFIKPSDAVRFALLLQSGLCQFNHGRFAWRNPDQAAIGR